MDRLSDKKGIVKDIILQLHKGLSVEEARDRFLKEVGVISSVEIAEIEQSLINEGMSPEEIKKFCNVHALLFEAALQKEVVKEESVYHPVYWFKLENKEIQKLVDTLKQQIENNDKQFIKETLLKLKDIDIHYTRKEQLLFPFLEKHGFFGPSKVMWGKDNEIRELLKKSISNPDDKQTLKLLIEEVEGMIFKEENILFPTAHQKLEPQNWVEILKESFTVGYAYIEPPKDVDELIKQLLSSYVEEPTVENNTVNFPTGSLTIEELMCILNTLPVDITFVDKDDKVKYFSSTKERIFLRTRSVIGRKVQNCHPPQSVDKVEIILSDFKEGKRNSADFWINFKGRYVYIRYFAVRNSKGEYLGTLEVTQDITDIKKLEGEKRLLDEKN